MIAYSSELAKLDLAHLILNNSLSSNSQIKPNLDDSYFLTYASIENDLMSKNLIDNMIVQRNELTNYCDLLLSNGSDQNRSNLTSIELPTSLKVFFYCLYSLIFLIGLIGNSIVCYIVLSNKAMYSVTNFFITNLALSDILLCLFSVPITPIYLLFFNYWPFGKAFCHLLPFSQGVSVYISAFTLISIAIDRYFVIIYPVKKRMQIRMCLLIICIIWFSGSILTAPYTYYMKIFEHQVPFKLKNQTTINCTKTICDEGWPYEITKKTFSICTSVIQFIIPFVIITFCYGKVFSKLKLRAKCKPGSKSARKEEIERERTRRTNRMLISMVIIFILCWLPLNVHNLIVDHCKSVNEWPYTKCFFILVHALAMSSTCYNPFVYAWLNENFRKEFKKIFNFKLSFVNKIQNKCFKSNYAKNHKNNIDCKSMVIVNTKILKPAINNNQNEMEKRTNSGQYTNLLSTSNIHETTIENCSLLYQVQADNNHLNPTSSQASNFC